MNSWIASGSLAAHCVLWCLVSPSVSLADAAAYRELAMDTPGLVDYYSLEEGFEDEFDGDNGPNDGLPSSDVLQFEAGVLDTGQSVLFGGFDYFTIANSIPDSFTITAWIRTSTLQIGLDTDQFYQGSGLIYADVGGVANDFGTAVTGTRFALGLGSPDATVHSATEVTNGEWVFVAAVREVDLDAGTAQFSVYVNGILEEVRGHGNTASLNAAGSITVGGNTIDGRYFTGNIDEIGLYGVALDPETILELHRSFLGITPCFSPSVARGAAPLQVAFDASCSKSLDSPIASYTWDFGDGTGGSGQSLTHTFEQPGFHRVRLTVADGRGLSAEESVGTFALFPSGDVSPCISRDAGRPFLPGGAALDGSCLTVFAGGRGIAAAEDEFHFVHGERSGDGALTVQLKEAVSLPAGARGGPMLRDTLDPTSAFAMMAVQPSVNGPVAVFLHRRGAGERVVVRTTATVLQPPKAYLRIERNAGEFIGSISGDGQTWTEVRRIALTAPADTMLAGLALTASDSRQTGVGAELVFCTDPAEGGLCGGGPPPGKSFHRGDVDDNGTLQLTDALSVLGFLFTGGAEPGCLEAADADDNGDLQLTDALRILGFLFLGGPPPSPPGPPPEPCGEDPEDSPANLGCNEYASC